MFEEWFILHFSSLQFAFFHSLHPASLARFFPNSEEKLSQTQKNNKYNIL